MLLGIGWYNQDVNVVEYDAETGFYYVSSRYYGIKLTAWDTFTGRCPGEAEQIMFNGRVVFDIPKTYRDLGMYFAEQRDE